MSFCCIRMTLTVVLDWHSCMRGTVSDCCRYAAEMADRNSSRIIRSWYDDGGLASQAARSRASGGPSPLMGYYCKFDWHSRVEPNQSVIDDQIPYFLLIITTMWLGSIFFIYELPSNFIVRGVMVLFPRVTASTTCCSDVVFSAL